ncbi:MAG: ATP-binding protein [Candidatus Paceibacterota bacterium]|jgi:ATP-dependent DNA helicase RecG
MKKEELEFLIQQGEGYNVEFKERYTSLIDKDICAMANATGGKILIGVNDAGKIVLTKLTNSMKSEIQSIARNFDPKFIVDVSEYGGIIIINVPEGTEKPYSAGGKFYIRQGANSQQLSREEIKNFFIKEGLILFDEMPNSKFDLIKDLNDESYANFIERADIKTKLDKKEVLNNLNLLDNGKMKNAGVLLFCKESTKFLRSSTIICALFMGKTKSKIIDSKEFNSDIYSNYEAAFNYLQSKLNTEYIIKGGPREEVLELPEKALREAILNAIAHRDYFSNANIQIYIFSDRIEIVNPGGLRKGIKVEDLYRKSFPRNNLLFGLMQRMDLVEKIGSGLMRMNDMMGEYLLPNTKIEADENWFSMSFERPDLQKMSIEQRIKKSSEKSSEKNSEKSSEKVLGMIKGNRRISAKEIGELLGISSRQVEKNIAKLKEEKLIKRIGPDKGGYWEIID